MKKFYKIILFAAFLAVSGCFAGVNAQTVTGSIAGGSVTRGSTARATVFLSLPGGLHVNSSRPGSEYAIPTSVRAASGRGVRIGAVSYPRGRNRKFEFSSNSINVYEGRTAFGFNVTVPENYRGDTVTVNATVKYQACTNEVCYPPKSKKVTFKARVK